MFPISIFPDWTAKLQGFASNFAEYLFLSISGAAGKIADVGAVIFLTVYFMLEGDEAYHWVLSFFPQPARARLDATLLRADARMGKWLLGQGGLMLILGLCSLIVFVLLKVRYAYALAVLMGALNIIPIVGAMVSMALVLLAAAIDSWEKVVGVAIFYAIYAQVETSYLTPRIMKSSVDLSALGGSGGVADGFEAGGCDRRHDRGAHGGAGRGPDSGIPDATGR